jgi:hypothetical protein
LVIGNIETPKEEGRRKKEEGRGRRRKKEEEGGSGRKKEEEGRGLTINN